MSKETPAAETKLEIALDEEMAQGSYVNLAVINHSDSEFVLDFIFVQPQVPRGKVRARIVTSPRHAKRLLQSLAENVRRYEQQHGPIESALPPASVDAGPVH